MTPARRTLPRLGDTSRTAANAEGSLVPEADPTAVWRRPRGGPFRGLATTRKAIPAAGRDRPPPFGGDELEPLFLRAEAEQACFQALAELLKEKGLEEEAVKAI